MIASLVLQPSFYCFSDSPKLSSFKNWTKQTHAIRLHRSNKLLSFANAKLKRSFNGRLRLSSTCFFNAGKDSKPDSIQDEVQFSNSNSNLQRIYLFGFHFNYLFTLQESKLDWPVLKRWEVPWGWQTASLTSLACGLRCLLNFSLILISSYTFSFGILLML